MGGRRAAARRDREGRERATRPAFPPIESRAGIAWSSPGTGAPRAATREPTLKSFRSDSALQWRDEPGPPSKGTSCGAGPPRPVGDRTARTGESATTDSEKQGDPNSPANREESSPDCRRTPSRTEELEYAQEYGNKVVADISYTNNATDVTSEVDRLIRANPDVLLHASYITDAILSLCVCSWVATSRMGFYLRAIKESHDVAKVLGIDVVRYRMAAIMISAFLTAMAGTFYAQYVLYLDPESVLILPISVQIVLVTMLGGAGSVMGPVIGAAILLPISEMTRVKLGFKGSGLDMIIYGTLIMLISVYQPQGVWGLIRKIGRKRK